MPAYEYVALDAKGKEKKGVLESDTARQARQQLRDQGLTPLSVTEGAAKAQSMGGKSRFRGGIKTAELAMITRQIATLSASGTPIEETLATVSRQTEKQRIKTLLMSIRSKVLEGYALADSLAEFPKVFPELYRATVSAGEQSGRLDGVLERLADYTEERQSAQSSISKALIYPIALCVFAIAIVALLLTYVVPQVVEVFADQGTELPTATRVLLASSDFFQQWGLVVFIAIVLGITLFKRMMRNEAFQFRVHSFLLRVPMISKLIRNFNSAQFSRTLSILAASGVPVLEALEIASQVISNRPMRRAVKTAATQVREGSSLSKSLERTGFFPPMLLHMIASGEASGKLDVMLERGAKQQERELDGVMSTFIGLFEPLVIIIMGMVVLGIVLAMLMPIFQFNQMVG